MTKPYRRTTHWLAGLIAVAATVVTFAGTPSTLYVYDNAGNIIRVTDTAVDPQNCGAANVVCSTNHVTAACSGGVCNGTCASGWGDCNSNKQTDGCEASLTTTSNCGGCGVTCSTNHIQPMCSSNGVCSGACASGWGDCNSNKQTDGCETSLATTANCGACGKVCSTNHVTPTCTAGVCGGTCATGWGDCNHNMQDGCETSLTVNGNCGACGATCRSPYVCDPDVRRCINPGLSPTKG